MIIRLLNTILILLLFYSSHYSQAVAEIADIPVMEEARFSKNLTQVVYGSDWELVKSEYLDLFLYDTQCKAYISDLHPDDVVAFYKSTLFAVRDNEPFTLDDIRLLKDMSISEVRYDGSEFGVLFNWLVKINNDELTRLFITITSTMGYKDEGGNSIFYFVMKKYKKNIVINFPTGDELKAALYPNVKYIPEESIKNLFMNTRVFITDDAIENILSFYQANLKVKPFKGDYGGYGFRDYNKNSSDFISIEKTNSGKYKIVYYLQP